MEIVEIKYEKTGKGYYFSPVGGKYRVGESVIVQAGGMREEYAFVAKENFTLTKEEVYQHPKIKGKLSKILRKATKEDDEVYEKRTREAKYLLDIYYPEMRKKNVKLLKMTKSFDGTIICAFITLAGKGPNTKLSPVKEAELRSIAPEINLYKLITNPRDETKIFGGIGACGLEFCCSTGMCRRNEKNLPRYAVEQGFHSYSQKCFGGCGQYLCCLAYEADTYSELYRITPQKDERVETPKGFGRVVYSSLLKGEVRVILDRNPNETGGLKNDEEYVPRYFEDSIKYVKRLDGMISVPPKTNSTRRKKPN